MQDRPLVLYYGTDAPTVEERWEAADRPFDLVGRTTAESVPATVADADVDCLVVAGGSDALAVVDGAVEAHRRLPVVAFGTGDLDAGTALERGVAHYVDLTDGEDPVDALAALEPVVERHRRERRERTMLDSLLDNIPLSVYFKDRESRFLKVSEAMTSMMGDPYIDSPDGVRYNTPEDIVGNTDFDIFPDDLAETAVEDDRSVMDNEEPIDRVEHAYGPEFDGSYVVTSKAPWHDERGDVVGMLGVTRDISERKRYEHQLERQNEQLQRFAGVLSHDLRNPLEVASGRLELAREDGDPEHFDAVERSLARMDELVTDVLTMARQGETVDDPAAVDLAAAARDAWDVVDSGDATLNVTTDVTVLADPGRLGQLLENLFRNSLEHATDRATDLTVTVGDLDEGRVFFVADDGVGIPADERESVFEPGFSTDDGTGLGLNIVETIADAHGWDTGVAESDDGGATFRFENVRTAVD